MKALFGRRVYVDANAIIYFGEAHPDFGPPARVVFEHAFHGRLTLVTSELATAEALVLPFRTGNQALADAYEEAMSPRGYLETVAVDRQILIASAKIRALTSNRLPDAIHLAAAEGARCEIFLTQDGKIRPTAGIQVIKLSDIDPNQVP